MSLTLVSEDNFNKVKFLNGAVLPPTYDLKRSPITIKRHDESVELTVV